MKSQSLSEQYTNAKLLAAKLEIGKHISHDNLNALTAMEAQLMGRGSPVLTKVLEEAYIEMVKNLGRRMLSQISEKLAQK